VPPGAVIYTDDVTDMARGAEHWRSYFVTRLCNAICGELDWQDYKEVVERFETYALDTPWGALDFAATHYSPNSIERVSNRIQSLLRFWSALDEYVFVGPVGLNPVSLADLIGYHYRGLLEMWPGDKGGDIPSRLDMAVGAMSTAAPDDIRERMIRALIRLAPKEEALKNDPRLQDPAWLSDHLQRLAPERLDDMSTGLTSGLLGALYDLKQQP
jgi:hypothetical protein